MPDQEQLDDFLEALESAGSPAKNPALHEALGWDGTLYEEVKAELVAKGIVTRGRGRSDSVSLVGAEPVAPQAAPAKAPAKAKPPATAPPTWASRPSSGSRPTSCATTWTRPSTSTWCSA